MLDTIEEIEALFKEEPESLSLEYKAGHYFNELSSDVRTEFVKDVSAFANGAGGTLIIGVAEIREGKTDVSRKFEPVTNKKVSIEQLTGIIKSNTDPVFSDFEIRSLDHPNGGRVLMVHVQQADTAHQSKLDRRYYQRTGPTSEPMFDFAIRDVMNRRTHPRVLIRMEVEGLGYVNQRDAMVYRIVPVLTNEGARTAHHWSLWVDLPANVAGFGTIHAGMPATHLGKVEHDGIDYRRIEFHSGPTLKNQAGTLLLPGQSWSLTLEGSFPELELRVNHLAGEWLTQTSPAIFWSFFLDDSPRKDGTIPCKAWRT